MLCAACNRPVHSRSTTALGKVWHSYHFVCSAWYVAKVYNETLQLPICEGKKGESLISSLFLSCHFSRVVLQEDNYTTLPNGTVACNDCSSSGKSTPHLAHTLRTMSSPCIISSRPSLTSIPNSAHHSFSTLPSIHPNLPSSQSLKSTSDLGSIHQELEEQNKSDGQSENEHTDPNALFSSDFYKNNRFYRSERRPLGSLPPFDDTSPPSLSSSAPSSFSESHPPLDERKDTESDTRDTVVNEEDNNAFSSDFYRKSYYYRKSHSLNTLNTETSTSSNSSNSEISNSDNVTKREKRLSRKGRLSIEIRLNEPTSPSSSEPEMLFSESFYKKSHHSNKKFDFLDFSNSSSQDLLEKSTPLKDKNNRHLEKDLLENQEMQNLLDTSEDMKARPRVGGSTSFRRLPPSMGIRVGVPSPSPYKKPEPVTVPVPAPSPSPPLSLPASPSPPSSPQLPRKYQSHWSSGAPPSSAPPVLTPPPSLSRSMSPPLSLPEEPSSSPQVIRTRIEEDIVRVVMDQLGSSSDFDKAPIAPGASSSSLMARKRRLKQAHKEATLQRQLSLQKNLVLEVATVSGGVRLNKATPGVGFKSSHTFLVDAIRSFSVASLRKAPTVTYEDAYTKHMKEIRAFVKREKLRQVVGKTTATSLLPCVNYLAWKGKNCVGVTLRDVQFLLRDPVASRDLCERLALRYRGIGDNSTDVGEVDCIVVIPHDVAISFAARLSVTLRIPLQILQQRSCKTSSSSSSSSSSFSSFKQNKSPSTTAMFPSGRGLYPFAGVETITSRGEEYELWLTARNCVRPRSRALVVACTLDNGAPLVAALLILRAAGANVAEMVALVEYQGFGGREKITRIHSLSIITSKSEFDKP